MKTAALAAPAPGAPLVPIEQDLGPLAPDDVEIAVEACALCHSDLHMIDNDWGISRYPLVPGHEVVGRVVARGDRVRALELGERVGIGWQCGSCHRCDACVAGNEQHCTGGKRRTCVDQPGGLAARVRAEGRFALAIPPELTPVEAAPLFCAGLTVYSPLLRHIKRHGARVGVVGLGGLGHLAVQIAKAMDGWVAAFDPVEGKKAEALGILGADAFNPDTGGLDLIVTTTSADLDWNAWMARLAVGGTLCILGVPRLPLSIHPDHLLDGMKGVTGSIIGSPREMRALLALAVARGIRPMTEVLPFAEGPKAVEKVRRGEARYRMVMTRAGI